MSLPKTMCACSHMADGWNNVIICKSCWQDAKFLLTGDGAHSLRSEKDALEAELSQLKAQMVREHDGEKLLHDRKDDKIIAFEAKLKVLEENLLVGNEIHGKDVEQINDLKADLSRQVALAKAEGEREGLEKGIRLYAWWKDGVQYVGSCGTTLEQTLKEIHK